MTTELFTCFFADPLRSNRPVSSRLLIVLVWDKLSSNDHVGNASFMVHALLVDASRMDPITGMCEDDVDGKHPISGSPFAPLLESVSKGNDVAWYGTPGADML